MKKFLKSRIFLVIVTAIIFGSIGSVVAYNYNAKDVSYTPKDENWNVNNVEGAIGSLYNKSKTYKKLDQSTTATAANIHSGKTAYDNNGNLITGTAANGDIYIPSFYEGISGSSGGGSSIVLKNQNYSKIRIGSRKKEVGAGTTYFEIYGCNDVNCITNDNYTTILKTQNATTQSAEYNISNYNYIVLVIECTAVNGINAWYGYWFNDITLTN